MYIVEGGRWSGGGQRQIKQLLRCLGKRRIAAAGVVGERVTIGVGDLLHRTVCRGGGEDSPFCE